MWLFALALAYPYLPGSDTDAFKGVSVFVGLIISLGSSGIVTQMMSGLTLTYSRALRVGDFVRIGDVEGTVTYLGSLSAKIKTLRNEEVTIPNAVVVANQIINYSRLAGSEGVYVGTSVTIGYDVPWRQVQALLLQAAGAHRRRAIDAAAERAPERAARLLRRIPAAGLRWRIPSSACRRSTASTGTSWTPSTSTACRSCRRTTRPIPRARRSCRPTGGSPRRLRRRASRRSADRPRRAAPHPVRAGPAGARARGGHVAGGADSSGRV